MPLSAYPPALPQPVYYASYQAAALAHNVHRTNLLQSLRGRIQSLASTEYLEGFSLKAMFSYVFTRRSSDDVEDYMGVGTSKTTPPIDLVETWLAQALAFLPRAGGAGGCVPGTHHHLHGNE